MYIENDKSKTYISEENSDNKIKENGNMAKLQQVLNDEIRRLAHRELSGAIKALKNQLVEMRKTLREQNQRIKTLEKLQPVPEVKPYALPAAPEKPVRVTSDRIRKWRMKLNLSQSQYAGLLGVNVLSVNHWESGKTEPRESQKQKIALLRDLGKRELRKLMAEKNIVPKKSKKVKKAAKKSAKKAVKKAPAKTPAVKKAPAKKPVEKKAPAKTSAVKKAPAKKPVEKKAVQKKA